MTSHNPQENIEDPIKDVSNFDCKKNIEDLIKYVSNSDRRKNIADGLIIAAVATTITEIFFALRA